MTDSAGGCFFLSQDAKHIGANNFYFYSQYIGITLTEIKDLRHDMVM